MVKILAFDTETSDRAPYIPGTTIWENNKKLLSIKDLKKKNSMWSTLLVKWPSIIQLAYILYDTEHPAANTKIFNKYIDIEDNIQISEESLDIHHISKDKIQKMESKDRIKIQDALKEFLEDVKKADTIVGHNVAFDRRMIVSELLRLTKDKDTDTDTDLIDENIVTMMKNKKFKCTQKITKPLCKLKIMNSKECYQYKTPKLIESYEHFFGYIPKLEMLHDALIDAIITLRVYCISIKINPFDINHTNKMITSYINKISPTKSKTLNKPLTKKQGKPKGKKTRKNSRKNTNT
jgi:DNA polymerase III epsilon subunit-like protein